MFIIAPIFVAFLAAYFATPPVAMLAAKFGVIDSPDGTKKLHALPVPLLGGLAVFIGIVAAILLALAFDWFPGTFIKGKYIIGIVLASFILIFGGALDDARNLKPTRQLVWPLLAALVIIASGIGVSTITNPLGGYLHLDRATVTVLWWQGIPYKLTLLADLFTLMWLMGMTYTTKLLDGLDGLVAGITAIGGLVIAAVSMMKEVSQPDTAILALAVSGAFLGFLIFNFHPARIFLGEGGSTLAGFLLGTLAIIAGGKIATTLLVFGLPILDAIFVVLRRLWSGKSPVAGDRSHLHFRLMDYGLTHRQTVLFFYFVAALFGCATLVLRGWEKIIALALLCSILPAATAISIFLWRKKNQ